MPALDAHLQMRSFDVDGTERSFWIPERRPKGPEVRLLIAFHDRGETGRKLANRTGLHHAATAGGLNVIFPDGLERVWDDHGTGRRDGADDDAYLRILLDHLRRRGETGDTPPLLVGYGENGAGFAERLAREGVHDLAGVLLVGGTAREASRALTPQPARPVPLILANAPQPGGRRPGLRTRLALANVSGNAVVSAETVLADWAPVNGPAGVPLEQRTVADATAAVRALLALADGDRVG